MAEKISVRENNESMNFDNALNRRECELLHAYRLATEKEDGRRQTSLEPRLHAIHIQLTQTFGWQCCAEKLRWLARLSLVFFLLSQLTAVGLFWAYSAKRPAIDTLFPRHS